MARAGIYFVVLYKGIKVNAPGDYNIDRSLIIGDESLHWGQEE